MAALVAFVTAFVLATPLQALDAHSAQAAAPAASSAPSSSPPSRPAGSAGSGPSSSSASSPAPLDFFSLRPVFRWKRSLLTERELVDRCLLLLRQCRVYQDVDLSAASASRLKELRDAIESQQQRAASPLLASPRSSSALSPSPSLHHKRQSSAGSGLLSLPLPHLSSSSSSPSSSAAARGDVHHPLNRFKLSPASEDLAIEFLSWSPADRAAFLCLQQQAPLLRELSAFLSILSSRLPYLTDEQLAQLRQQFAYGDKREKAFALAGLQSVERRQRQQPQQQA